MKKNVFKKVLCAAMAAMCIVTATAPVSAETTEAATKSVTSVYKYHLTKIDKKRNDVLFSKTAYYKDFNSLPAVTTGKTTVHVPEVTSDVKSTSDVKDEPTYESFIRFKAPKTGTYVCTLTNLEGMDQNELRVMLHNLAFCQTKKVGKKYTLDYDIELDTIGDCENLWENNYLEKLRTMMDNYKQNWTDESVDIDSILRKDYYNEEEVMGLYSSNKIQFKTKLKKGKTYVIAIGASGKTRLGNPYHDSAYDLDSMSCLRGGNYKAAYSFDVDIQFKK